MMNKPLNFIRSKPWFHRLVKITYNNLPFPKKLIVVPHTAGFFSCFNKVMNHLACSLHHNWIIAIEADWHISLVNGRPNFPYGTQKDGNLWEHFFQPLPFRKLPFLLPIRTSAYKDYSITDTAAYDLYKSGQEWRNIYHAAYAKYIRIRPHIQEKVEQIYRDYLAGNYCIGVHVRNDSHAYEQKTGKMPATEKYVEKIKENFPPNNKKTIIYLATDVEKVVSDFKHILGDKVIVQPNVTRSACHGKQRWCNNPDPQLKDGEEILIDCLLLARCNVIIHTTSNIATAVGFINKDIKMIYCE